RATDYQGVRFCDSCQRNVYFVDSVEALAIHVRERRCVAYLADASSDVFETIAEAPDASAAREDGHPCAVLRAEPPRAVMGMVLGTALSPEEQSVVAEQRELERRRVAER